MPATITRPSKSQNLARKSPVGAVVRCDRTGKIFPVEGIIDGGRQFIVQRTKTKKEFVINEKGESLIVNSKVTVLETMNLIGRSSVTRIH